MLVSRKVILLQKTLKLGLFILIMKKIDIKIELAKSWFELSKLLATIGGFIIVTGGVFMAFTSNLISASTQLVSSLDPDASYTVSVDTPMCQITNAISDVLPGTFDGASYILIFGMVIGFSSIIPWWIGQRKLVKLIKEQQE